MVAFHPQAVEAYPDTVLLYYPVLPSSKEPPTGIFEAGERSEFQQKDFAKAILLFREF